MAYKLHEEVPFFLFLLVSVVVIVFGWVVSAAIKDVGGYFHRVGSSCCCSGQVFLRQQ